MNTTDAATASSYEPPDCGICSRTLLVGEVVRSFTTNQGADALVCELCAGEAIRRGYESIDVSRHAERVHAAGAVRDAGEYEAVATIGLAPEQAAVIEDDAPVLAPFERGSEDGAATGLMETIRRQERELQRIREQVDPGRRQRDSRTIERQKTDIAELRKRLNRAERERDQLRTARESEVNPQVMQRHAVDAFNISGHKDHMARIARTLDAPIIRVRDQGPGIPRRVHVLLVWDIAWYEFCVKLDLGKGQASVHELDQGGDPSVHGYDTVVGNAQWRESGIVLS